MILQFVGRDLISLCVWGGGGGGEREDNKDNTFVLL